MEQLQTSPRPITEIISDVERLVPDAADLLRSSNGDTQRPLYLADKIENPKLAYDELMNQNFAQMDSQLQELSTELVAQIEEGGDDTEYEKRHVGPFSDFIMHRRLQVQLLDAFKSHQNLPEGIERDAAANEYQRLNESLYGQVDMPTMHALLSNKMYGYTFDPQDETAQRLLTELNTMVPEESLDELPPPYQINPDTFEAVKVMAEAMYESLLRHIPDRDEAYSSDEILEIMTTIVRQEFGYSAADWQVLHRKQKGLSVSPDKEEVRVSPTITADGPKLRGLVVHELGVHMLKAIRGAETGLLPFAIGMAGYSNAEEGTGRVMEQAISGKTDMAGAGHYITAGLLQSGRTFRQTFEINWRLVALDDHMDGGQLDAAALTKARESGYSKTARLAKGDMPTAFLSPLSYYNGTRAMWAYFDQYGQDELMLNLALLGKLDPTNPAHLQTALETRTI